MLGGVRRAAAARRIVRHCATDPAERATRERILATIRRAPSGGYSQDQRLVVDTDGARKRAIPELLDEPRRTAEGLEPWIESAALSVAAGEDARWSARTSRRSVSRREVSEVVRWERW